MFTGIQFYISLCKTTYYAYIALLGVKREIFHIRRNVVGATV